MLLFRLKKKNFTLIELLITVSILLILVSLLLPALGRARNTAFRITCSGNLKTIGQAFVFYSGAYDDYFPPPLTRDGGMHWSRLLYDVARFPIRNSNVGNALKHDTLKVAFSSSHSPVMDCPVIESKALLKPVNSAAQWQLSEYAMNSGLIRLLDVVETVDIPYLSVRSSRLRRTSARGLVTECAKIGNAYTDRLYLGGGLLFPHLSQPSDTSVYLRGNQANILFVDGHVASHRAAEFPLTGSDQTPLSQEIWSGKWQPSKNR